MRLFMHYKPWWGRLSAIGFSGLLGWALLNPDPVFGLNDAILLCLLPLAWGSISGNFSFFQSDLKVFTPKNIMLFIWLNKLVIIPVELLWVGNKVYFFETNGHSIMTEISVVLVSFGAFITGWQIRTPFFRPSRFAPSLQALKRWAVFYLSVAIISLWVLYGSLADYWAGSIFTYVTREVMEQAGGSVVGFIANVGQRFWFFGVIFLWCWWRRKYPHFHHIIWQVPWVCLCVLGTLSSNRSNMIYPLLTFLSVAAAGWQLKNKTGLVAALLGGSLLILFFGYLRVQTALGAEQVSELFNVYLSDRDYVWYAHQLYFGSPYQITPLLSTDSPTFTILASLLDPVPVLGKEFREYSGPFIYNLAIYNSTVSQDKVIPVAGELFYNGGFVLLALGHFLFGIVYRRLDAAFKNHVVSNPTQAAGFFYLALLFNACLLLSLSVLVQFLLYNAPPALLIIAANWWQMRKAS